MKLFKGIAILFLAAVVCWPAGARAQASSSLDTELLNAAGAGDVTAVKLLLNKGANIEAKDKLGNTALMMAAFCGKADVVKLLLDKGANIEATDKYGNTALISAAALGKADVVELLLDKGANIEAKDNYGYTALIQAITRAPANADMVKLLLDKGANIEAKNEFGHTALIQAVTGAHANADVVKLLLDKGANIEAKDKYNGITVLHRAILDSVDQVIAKLLLDKGANIEAKDKNGDTALIQAVTYGKADMVKLLLDKGANIEAKGEFGDTALIQAVAYEKSDVVKLLLDKGANIEAKDEDGDTALIQAVAYGKADMVKLLLDKGANIEAKGEYGYTALIQAITRAPANADMVKLLLDKGANIEAKDEDGDTALHLAMGRGYADIVEILQQAFSQNPIASVQRPEQSKAYSGIYSLQSAIDFDTLDGASYDPETGVLSLWGHKARQGQFQRIDYLDHLAAALESDSPIFSLEWTPSSERDVDRALESQFTEASPEDITDRLGDIFDSNGLLNAKGVWFFKALGVDVKEGMNNYEVNGKCLEAVGRPKAGRVLAAFGMFALAKKRNDEQARAQGLFDMMKYVGVYDDVVERNRKWRNNEITETECEDLSLSEFYEALGKVFGWDDRNYSGTYKNVRRQGRSSDQASEVVFRDFQNDLNTLPRQIMDTLTERVSEILVPPSIMTELIGVEPRVHPVFTRLPEHSQLARVALEADVFCKSLMDMPDLKRKVPEYRTYFEWLRDRNEHPVTGEGHLWISQDNFELFESPDGRALRFGRTPMRFYIERYTAGHKSTPDPQLNEYASLLTRCYNDIAEQNPALYQLRECTKVVAIAHWLKRRGAKIMLPSEGRTYWDPPLELPGVIYMTMAVKAGPSGAILTAVGGVDFCGDSGWRYSKGPIEMSGQDIVSLTIQQTKEKIEQIFKRKIDIPSPQPLGWVNSATVDGRPVTTIAVATKEIGQNASSSVQLQKNTGEQTALLLWKSGDLDGAEQAYRKQVESCSGDVQYCASLRMLYAKVLHEKGDDTKAIQELNEATRLAPGLPLTQLLLAEELSACGDLQGAQEALRKYLGSDPANQAAAKILTDLQAGAISTGGGTHTGYSSALDAVPLSVLNTSLEELKANSYLRDIHVRFLASPAANNPEYRNLQKQEAQLVQQMQEIDKKLDLNREERVSGKGDKIELEKLELKLKQESLNAKKQLDTVKEDMKNIEVKWDEEKKE
jgi:ankyrin repeat protein